MPPSRSSNSASQAPSTSRVGIREDAIRAHPDFPWLDADDPAGIARYLGKRKFLAAGEDFLRCEIAGEGNMNLTLRIHTSTRRFILKQSRPWVEKYPEIEAPWDRSESELRFYQRVSSMAGVAERMPQLLGGEAADRVLLLEDLSGARDLASLYSEPKTAELREVEIDALAAYLSALHAGTRGRVGVELANRQMRALNHAHIFVIPLQAADGAEVDTFEPGLGKAAQRLLSDAEYLARVRETGERYLRDGACLLHGDFFPGSWLRSDRGLRVIDPEFSFPGDPEVDLGCAVAHLALAQQPVEVAERFLRGYSAGALDPLWLARYAAVEVMRRLIGVAQLPLAESRPAGRRARLLERSRETALGDDFRALFEQDSGPPDR
jgi:5-methylthioribose kinase